MILFINPISTTFESELHHIEINRDKTLEISAVIVPYLKKLKEQRKLSFSCSVSFEYAKVYNKNREEVKVKDIKILIDQSSFYFEILDKNEMLHKSEKVYFNKLS